VAEIARSTGIASPTLYSWRHRWKLEGQLVPASSKAPCLLLPIDIVAQRFIEHCLELATLVFGDLAQRCRHLRCGLGRKLLAGGARLGGIAIMIFPAASTVRLAPRFTQR
jgi:hypothetical protein